MKKTITVRIKATDNYKDVIAFLNEATQNTIPLTAVKTFSEDIAVFGLKVRADKERNLIKRLMLRLRVYAMMLRLKIARRG